MTQPKLSHNRGGDDTTQGLTPSACDVALTTTSGHSSVRSDSGDGSKEQSDSDDTDAGLSANRFDLELDDDLIEAATADDAQLEDLIEAVDTDTKADRLADHYSEQAARQMDAPEGEWWP